MRVNIFKKIICVAVTVVTAIILFGCGGGGSGAGKLVTEVSPIDGGSVSRDITQEVYPAGTNVTLTATAASGYVFKEWQGAISGNTNTITVATVGNMKVTALFEKVPTFTDSRDGKTYRMITIGNQTWMAENLNFATIIDSWCYDGQTSNCDTYGRLYGWDIAMTVCPAGWHLPTDAEWTALENTVGGSSTAGKKLKAQSGWRDNGNGTDVLGFSALPGGLRGVSDFRGVGLFGVWWTATEQDARHARTRGMDHGRENVLSNTPLNKAAGSSVRCVRD